MIRLLDVHVLVALVWESPITIPTPATGSPANAPAHGPRVPSRSKAASVSYTCHLPAGRQSVPSDAVLDHAEFARWLEASDDEAALARALVDLEAFNAVALHSEQAAQLLLKGLLRGVGAARDAWGHALPELVERAAAAAGLELSHDLLAHVSVLERDYKPSRYPDALVSGTPRSNYSAADAQRALKTLNLVRHAVVAAWGHLADHDLQVSADEHPGTVGGENT